MLDFNYKEHIDHREVEIQEIFFVFFEIFGVKKVRSVHLPSAMSVALPLRLK